MSYNDFVRLFRTLAIGCLVLAGMAASDRPFYGFALTFMGSAFVCYELAICATRYAREEQGR